MRLRWQRRVMKQLRRMRGHERTLPVAVAKLECGGLPLVGALRAIMLDPARFHQERAAGGQLLAVAGGGEAVQALLGLFFQQTEKDDLYGTALTLESLNDRRAVRPLIRALLQDGNPHRRHAAARALGWICQPGRAAALALAHCLVDPTQPQPAREEAAESLAYVGTRETIEALISVLRDPDVRIRFWAVFGLGGSCRGDVRAIRALESVLDDSETPPGNWWPVGKEALAMLASKQPSAGAYETKVAAERQRILANPNATAEDRRWADSYSHICEAGAVNAGARVITL
jgi:HEAT repeat protein